HAPRMLGAGGPSGKVAAVEEFDPVVHRGRVNELVRWRVGGLGSWWDREPPTHQPTNAPLPSNGRNPSPPSDFGAVLLHESGGGGRVVDRGFLEGRAVVAAAGARVGAAGQEELGDGALVAVGGGVEGRAAIVGVAALRVHVRAGVE